MRINYYSLRTKSEIIIIGGGIVGLCSAYYLAKTGHSVTVLEKTDGSDGCSYGNAGFISPSHFIPLAAPGIVAKGLRWMLNPESPFYIRPRLNLSLAKWGWQFMKHATATHVNNTKQLLADFTQWSFDLHQQIAEEQQMPMQNKGIVMLCKTESCLEHEVKYAEEAKELGIETKVMDMDQLHAFDPSTNSKGAGAVVYTSDAYMHPGIFMKQMYKTLEKLGVQILTNQEVVNFETIDSKITKIITRSTEYEADEVVIATGSYSAPILKLLGNKMLLEAGKGYSVDWHNKTKMPEVSYILEEARVAITPMNDFIRLAGTMELDGINLNINERRVAGFLKSIEAYLPDYKYEEIKSLPVWAGMRPCSPDGLPFLGRDKKYKNLIVAAGHAMVGFTLGPATGKLVAEIINETKTTIKINQLAIDRYE